MKNKEKYSYHCLDVVTDKFREQRNEQRSGFAPTLKDFLKWLNEEYEEPKILDDAERRYLRNIILPFYDSVKSVSKLPNPNSDREFICIDLGAESVMLPYFTANTMYKNMKVQKEYTLKELDIRK